ncbi:uncharacterized protein LOC117080346 [Trachypithecus francoisi]|uniref:uncharacterized protein LOC117080346 n=1 Tax=Trachypithecus francoisi TaxID=54180 RepID=UPI00141B4C26|nr:uncharacterized protein LOC117080346 [Trachypithecus francoisi]
MSLLRTGACLSLVLVSVGSIPVPSTVALEMEGIEGEQILKHSLHLSLLPSHSPVFQPEAFALRPRLWPTYHRYPSSRGRGNLKRKRRTGNGNTPRKDHVKTWREDSQLQAKERGLRRNQPCRHLDLGLPVSKIMRK